MFLNLVLLLILTVFILHNVAKARKYTLFSSWHNLFVPLYSVVLFFITMKWETGDLQLLAVLTPIALFAGWLETRDVRIRESTSRKTGKRIYEMRRGIPYTAGWTLTVVLGIAIHAWQAHAQILDMFSEAIWDNILEEINPLSLFTTTHTWYIWFLSGVSSIVFLVILRIKARTMSIEHIHSEELPI